MITRIFKGNKRKGNFFVYPDEVFLDSKNLQNFDRQQFEGRIEKPITKKTVIFLGIFFLAVTSIFLFRLISLQVEDGEAYRKRSENNTLAKVNIFTERGIIYDRNKEQLAWNQENTEQEEGSYDLYTRAYLSPGFAHVLGYVSYPTKDKNTGRYWQNEFEGIDGLEKMYDEMIKGENGSKIVETDALGKIHSENIVNAPKWGNDLITTIDSGIQKELFVAIKGFAERNNFSGGAGIIMDINNGEIIASTSFPEYDSEILSLGKDKEKIGVYLNDNRKFFLDRTISGLYTPGSIVKPFFALAALVEKVIDPNKQILSTGSIAIPNPYFPDQETVFRDWKAHGWTNMAEALAVSSDVYFYEIGGGFEDQKGLGIINLEKYSTLFGLKEKTGIDLPDEKEGVIPSPEWKAKIFKNDPWRVGDTYNTAIGQYGFQVTPMAMVRGIGALASKGTLTTPHFVLSDTEKKEQTSTLEFPEEYYQTVHEGMRQAVTSGTALALNVPYVELAAKTGTAQIGVGNNKINSWVVGFFPYENPKYSFAILAESGPSTTSSGASLIMREVVDWMSLYAPEYFK